MVIDLELVAAVAVESNLTMIGRLIQGGER